MSSLVGGPGQPLSTAQFKAEMDLLVGSMHVVQFVELGPLWEWLEKAETLGPILDPTMYMRGGADNLADQREILQAAQAVQGALDRIRTRMDKRAAGGR